VSVSDALAADLRRIVSDERAVLTSDEDLIAYGYDAAWFEGRALAVVMPKNVDEVASIHRFAARTGTPITPRGMGSGLSGGAVPSQRAILLNLMRMNRIL
jgi:FAD/FMN-containing dehydrogenase